MLLLQALLFIGLWGSIHLSALPETVPGVQTAIRRNSGGVPANLTNFIRNEQRGGLQFQFSSSSHINGWWCVKMYENTANWHDNYLCTPYDIGLSWYWEGHRFRNDIKCVFTPEPDDRAWIDNYLCLPVSSTIELIWSIRGPVIRLPCVFVGDSASPPAFHDNYLCWKEHKA